MAFRLPLGILEGSDAVPNVNELHSPLTSTQLARTSHKLIKAKPICIIHGPGGLVAERLPAGQLDGTTSNGGVPAHLVEVTIVGTLVSIVVSLFFEK